MADSESPLVKALPPETDYLTYLTIVEYNLTKENLPILHEVLQDEKLTVNIGWDLVHLLTPMLPASEQCLQDIARLGNPREVILKVTESLRLIEHDVLDTAEAGRIVNPPSASTKSISSSQNAKATEASVEGSGTTQVLGVAPLLPLPVTQFTTLLSMLSTLHPRIKTRYPSRFLSTTLQAILTSFSASTSHREEMVLAIVRVIKSVRRIQRPVLPSRQSSGLLSSKEKTGFRATTGQGQTLLAAAPDPEAAAGVSDTPEEIELQTKLFQAFVTHILEEYMLGLDDKNQDVPGMAWCSRIMEKLHPKRSIPGIETFAVKFNEQEQYQRRIDSVGRLVTIANDLDLKSSDLLSTAIEADKSEDRGEEEDDPPNNAAEIPLSRPGSLLLYTARQVSSVLYQGSFKEDTSFSIFQDHNTVLKQCLSSPASFAGTLGNEPEALIDAALALGLISVERNSIGEPQSDEQFVEYLQVIALISSNCPSPNLRGHAHFLTSTLLRSHPDENVRLAFIRDTLEHCPFENLKVSAVAWIKGETIEANPPAPGGDIQSCCQAKQDGGEKSIFAQQLALDSLAPFIFPSLTADLVTAPILDAFATFQANLSFYLASLNLMYLLIHATHLHENLSIQDLWNNNDIAGSFIQPLRDAKARFAQAFEEGGALSDEKNNTALIELELLEETLQRVTNAVPKLNHA